MQLVDSFVFSAKTHTMKKLDFKKFKDSGALGVTFFFLSVAIIFTLLKIFVFPGN
jgi:hypothetical protein